MVELVPSRVGDMALARELHCSEARALLFPGPVPTVDEADAWFIERWSGTNRGMLTAYTGGLAPAGLVWFEGIDGIGATLSVGLIERGKGHAREIGQLACRYAFGDLNLHRLSTTVVEGNEAAMKLVAEVGTLEGVLREAFLTAAGQYLDVHVYGLLASEWKGKE